MTLIELLRGQAGRLLPIVLAVGLVLVGCGTPDNGGQNDRSVAYDNPLMVARPLDNAWSQVATTHDMVYVAGQRGRLADGLLAPLGANGADRIRQAFQNMRLLALAQGAELPSCVRLVVYVTNLKYRAVVNSIEGEPEFWGQGPKPPRTLVVVSGLDEGDIAEVQGDFVRVHQ